MIATPQNRETSVADPLLKSFERLEKSRGEESPSWVFPVRKAGLARFAETGFPTLRDEDWLYTNVAPIANLPFQPILDFAPRDVASGSVDQLPLGKLGGVRLVFVNGSFVSDLSVLPQKNSRLRVENLKTALIKEPNLLEMHFAKSARVDDNPFTALNTAFFQDGAFVHATPDSTLEEPIVLFFISTATGLGNTSHPRNLILAENGSRLTVLECYAQIGEPTGFTNAVTEVVVGESAAVEYCKFQDESPEAFHVASIHAHLGARCNFTAHSVATGARLSRNNIRVKMDGEASDCVLNGLYLTKGDQLCDHHMIVEHAKPHCTSHEYFNGIMDGRSRGVFHGRILVRPEAQKTDAKQTNKNLLLSDGATANTKPQLEIYADDVKCTHGATIGQLNDDSIFYLRARGIGLETARRMLIHAFAGEIVERIQCAAARKELDDLIWDRLEQNPHVAERR
ncbi:MAG: Fe-S cluster assembly protein SufD [Verrucomicrobia bacterium]|nr:Fe-S cluster assembly protein SufD [Verrucomicrobiota bacterium]